MTFVEAFKNDPQARNEFHEYLDEMAEEHVHVAERLHDGDENEDKDEEWDEEDDGQPTEYEEWQDFMGGDDWDFGQYDEGGY